VATVNMDCCSAGIRRPQPSAGRARPRKSGLVATGCGCILGQQPGCNCLAAPLPDAFWGQSPGFNCLAAPLPEVFSGMLGAFQELFSWLQKATLGSSLPSKPPRRPCHRLWLHSGGSSLASTASRRLCRKFLAACWALSKNFSSGVRKRR